MLALKVSVNFADKNGHTPLYVVLQGSLPGKEGLVRALLEAGADIHFKPPLSTIMTPLEKAVMFQQHALVDIMLQHQPLHNNPKAPKGVYLHAAARTVPSKRMFSALIRSGASVTELDSNGDTPLSVFLKSVADQPHWMAHTRGAANQVCATVWYLWNKKVDINLRNKSGKAITSYLTALRIYNGDNLARKRIAEELQLCVEVVPAEGADEAEGLKTLRFRHGLMGLGKIGSQGVGQ
ncbi:putative nacht and ankyrin domain protein [Diaporthe ampelina]|uniref:Putative nacht and ankyrin domain protein n=1 Tax=Diaporthe ampelina TaxID=1214573 RepID=A0A0G2FWD5_9PEZI|nr:putative nacht and ankyrin domain protein [Diaporthe ampelina]